MEERVVKIKSLLPEEVRGGDNKKSPSRWGQTELSPSPHLITGPPW